MNIISKEIAIPPIANPIGFFPSPMADKIKPKSQNNKRIGNNTSPQVVDDKNNINNTPNNIKVNKEITNPMTPILFF